MERDPRTDPRPGDVARVVVPDGHPLVGTVIDLYPASGATTYLDGRMAFTSPGVLAVERELDGLREELRRWARDAVVVEVTP